MLVGAPLLAGESQAEGCPHIRAAPTTTTACYRGPHTVMGFPSTLGLNRGCNPETQLQTCHRGCSWLVPQGRRTGSSPGVAPEPYPHPSAQAQPQAKWVPASPPDPHPVINVWPGELS